MIRPNQRGAFVRSRRLFPLIALGLAALALTSCSGTSAPTASSSSSASSSTSAGTAAATDVCEQPAAEGDISKSVTVSGDDLTAAPTIAIGDAAVPTAIERTVALAGTGDKLADGDYVSYAVTMFDATGKQTSDQGHDGTALTEQLTTTTGIGQIFGCANVGSRIVIAAPQQDGSAGYWVFDVLGATPGAQWCTVSDKPGKLPEVAFDTDGKPTITIPAGAAAPTEVELSVLTEGDGEVVGEGDSVTVDYTGVKWSDGTVFDSSWDRGEPATFSTTGVVTGFKRALEGQKVGSTVLVAMPPKCGYAGTGNELADETLVFVVKIESSTPTAG